MRHFLSVRLGRTPEVSKLELKGLLPAVCVISDKRAGLWPAAFLGPGRRQGHELGVPHVWNRKSSHLRARTCCMKSPNEGAADFVLNFWSQSSQIFMTARKYMCPPSKFESHLWIQAGAWQKWWGQRMISISAAGSVQMSGWCGAGLRPNLNLLSH